MKPATLEAIKHDHWVQVAERHHHSAWSVAEAKVEAAKYNHAPIEDITKLEQEARFAELRSKGFLF